MIGFQNVSEKGQTGLANSVKENTPTHRLKGLLCHLTALTYLVVVTGVYALILITLSATVTVVIVASVGTETYNEDTTKTYLVADYTK